MKFLTGLLLAATLILHALPGLADDAIRLGILAFRPKEMAEKQWAPLAQYLESSLHRKIALFVYSYEELEMAVMQGNVDIVLTNSSHYVLLKYRNSMSSPLVTQITLDGKNRLANFGGVIFCRADSDINSLKDLRGKKIASISTESLGGFQMQAYEMLEAGVPVPSGNELMLTGMPHDLTINAVLTGKADAGFARSSVLESLAREGKLDLSKLKIINKQPSDFPFAVSTRLYPEWPVTVLPQIDEQLARHLTVALLSLRADNKAAITAGISGFTIPADYSGVEEMMRKLRVSPFNASPEFTLKDFWNRYSSGISIALVLLVLMMISMGLRMRRINQRITQEQQHFATLFEASPEPTLIIIQNRLIDCNAAAVKKFSHSGKSSLLQKNLAELSPIRQPDGSISSSKFEIMLNAAANGVDQRFEWRFLDSEDCEFIADVKFTPISLDSKTYILVVSHDITSEKKAKTTLLELNEHLEQKIMERTRELDHAKNDAEAANRAKSEFLANMSHEIRTPMNSITGMTHLALKTELSPKQRDYLEKIQRSSHHLLGVINEILDFSKIEAGKIEIEISDFDFEKVIKTISQFLVEGTSSKGLDYKLDVEANIPRLMRGDPLRLNQILLNLLSNAIKFTHHGYVSLRIYKTSENDQTFQLQFEVQDTGIGISSEDTKKLFKNFQQVDSTITRKYGGTGLGLAISQKLVELMHGNIGVESIPDAGSKFWVKMTFEKTSKNFNEEFASSQNQEILNHDNLKGARILLAEDNQFNQQVAQEILEQVGIVVIIASNGSEALDLIRKEPFDCVLMDMQMPEMDGVQATRMIREMPAFAHIPIIAMTANATNTDQQLCSEAGMSDFLTKPIMPGILYSTLSRWLGK